MHLCLKHPGIAGQMRLFDPVVPALPVVQALADEIVSARVDDNQSQSIDR